MARLRPTLRAMLTIGVWQNHPPLPPGAAKPAVSAATARSHVGDQLAAGGRGQPCTFATTGCGTPWISSISSVQVQSIVRTCSRSAPATSAKSCPAEKTGPLPASTMPAASLSPTSRNARHSSRRWAVDSALRRSGRFMVIVASSPCRETSTCS
jgi:hypothetical protein